MSGKKSERKSSGQATLTTLMEKLDQMASEILSFRSEIGAFKEMLKSFNDRLTTTERSIRSLVSSPQQNLPLPRQALTQLSSALLLTLEAVEELAPEPGQWLTIEQIAARTGRSVVTESNYAKELFDRRILDRRPQLQETSPGRKVRKWVYRPRK